RGSEARSSRAFAFGLNRDILRESHQRTVALFDIANVSNPGFALRRGALGNMGWPSHPIAICTTCGATIEDPRFINERCNRRVGGRRCECTYGITMSARDWKRCSSCSGLGFRGDRRCNLCWGIGWAYVGEPIMAVCYELRRMFLQAVSAKS